MGQRGGLKSVHIAQFYPILIKFRSDYFSLQAGARFILLLPSSCSRSIQNHFQKIQQPPPPLKFRIKCHPLLDRRANRQTTRMLDAPGGHFKLFTLRPPPFQYHDTSMGKMRNIHLDLRLQIPMFLCLEAFTTVKVNKSELIIYFIHELYLLQSAPLVLEGYHPQNLHSLQTRPWHVISKSKERAIYLPASVSFSCHVIA